MMKKGWGEDSNRSSLWVKYLLICIMIIGSIAGGSLSAQAAAKPKLSKTKLTLTVGKKQTLKVKNAEGKKIKWRSANKHIASVSAKGQVKAKTPGKTIMTAKVGGKTLKCRITVRKKPAEK